MRPLLFAFGGTLLVTALAAFVLSALLLVEAVPTVAATGSEEFGELYLGGAAWAAVVALALAFAGAYATGHGLKPAAGRQP